MKSLVYVFAIVVVLGFTLAACSNLPNSTSNTTERHTETLSHGGGYGSHGY
jgi:hypothetical protein